MLRIDLMRWQVAKEVVIGLLWIFVGMHSCVLFNKLSDMYDGI